MRPFQGIRVLDLTHVFAGPFCTYQLGVLGAEIIKIEPPDRPDLTRAEGADPALNAQGMGLSFQAQGGGKKTLALDLKSDEGRQLFDRLVPDADVVVQNYAGQSAEVLGLKYDRLKALNPTLIYCAISGFGQSGPKQDHPAYDSVIQAFSGVLASNGEAGADPVRIGPAVVDYGTGAQAALAIAAALYGRAETGQGRCIDVAMCDAALMLMASHTVTALATGDGPAPHGNHDPDLAGYASYDSADGTIMIGAFTNRQMADLMRALGDPVRADQIMGTPRANIATRRAEDAAFLKQVLKSRSAEAWETHLNAHHVPAARVRQLRETLAEPQIASRAVLQDSGAPVGPAHLPVAGFQYDHGGPHLDHGPRAHGADSQDVLAGIGVSAADFTSLKDRGIVA